MRNKVQADGLATLATLATNLLKRANSRPVSKKNTRSGVKYPEKVQTIQSGLNKFQVAPKLLLPEWCSPSCPRLEYVDLPDGYIPGCILDDLDWQQIWRRISSLPECPVQVKSGDFKTFS